MRRIITGWMLLLLLLTGLGGVQAQDDAALYEGTVPAPEFPEGLEWVNTTRPLSLEALRGKIIILDFWTYGCINCIHMIPVLEAIQAKYPNEVVVIGVHSAKFGPSEGLTENIRQIVERYNIRHPVINDHEFIVWSRYGVRAWPTFVVIDPQGNVVAMQAGEIPFEAFDAYVGGMIAYYDGQDVPVLDRTPLPTLIDSAGDPAHLLLFPGKVLIDAPTNRLFIADTNHHRIVIVDMTTRLVTAVIGSGQRGSRDGTYPVAQFNAPHGMALRDNILYVADTNNHLIRRVDLESRAVTTLAGTGRMGQGLMPFTMAISDPLTFDLRSPWDVAFDDTGRLFIAMAGTHQIWGV